MAIEKDGELIPKIKISENIEKITNPGYKKVYRLYDNENGKAIADLLTVSDEPAPSGDGYVLFDPQTVWKKKKLKNFTARNLQVRLFDHGKKVYDSPDIETIKQYCREQVETLWEETLRFENPQSYYVDLSQKLYELKQEMIREHRDRNESEL